MLPFFTEDQILSQGKLNIASNIKDNRVWWNGKKKQIFTLTICRDI